MTSFPFIIPKLWFQSQRELRWSNLGTAWAQLWRYERKPQPSTDRFEAGNVVALQLACLHTYSSSTQLNSWLTANIYLSNRAFNYNDSFKEHQPAVDKLVANCFRQPAGDKWQSIFFFFFCWHRWIQIQQSWFICFKPVLKMFTWTKRKDSFCCCKLAVWFEIYTYEERAAMISLGK